MNIESQKRPRQRGRPAILVLLAILLRSTSSLADDFASELNAVVKTELEKEFGALNDRIMVDETHVYGRVIAIDYQLQGDARLDDTWGDKVVAAHGRLGVSAAYDGDEVWAEQQSVAGKTAASIQFITAQNVDEPDAIALSAMFRQRV